MRLFIAFLVLGWSGLSLAQAYRWVDENGVTHYSNVPPPSSEEAAVEEKDVSQASRRTSNQARHGKPSGAQDNRRPESDPNTSEDNLNCAKALEYTLYSIEQSLEVGRTNRDDGYINDKDYETGRDRLRRLEGRVSVQHCRRSRGSNRAFYACMENGYSPALICVNETQPELARNL